jgi:hypothetical protein
MKTMWRVYSLILLISILGSCNERYFHLSKVKAATKRGTFDISYKNESPVYIGLDYEKHIRKAGIKNLERQGFQYTEKNPKYTFIVSLRVDTSANLSTVFYGPSPLAGYYEGYKKFITVTIQTQNNKSGTQVFERDFMGYFYNNYNPDLHRTISISKFLLNDIPDLY